MDSIPSSAATGKRSWLIPAACVLWLAVRLIYNSVRQLAPDEAYYWVWSRHLAFGYLDHPPLVAWMIAAGTFIFGTSEFSVRFFTAILSLGTILIAVNLTRHLFADKRAAILTAAILLLSPPMAVMGTIVTPDSPACFFSACALLAAVKATRQPKAWLIFGAFLGEAMFSKYTAVLVVLSVGLALISCRPGRKALFSVWFWLAILIAILLFLPVIIWNCGHDWASFRFQLNHGTSDEGSSPLWNWMMYAIGQLAIYSPVLLILAIAAAGSQFRRISELNLAHRVVLSSAILPPAFFALTSLRHQPEPNWTILAYVPLTVLLSGWLSQAWERRKGLAQLGIAIAAVTMVVAHVPEVMYLVPTTLEPHIPGPWEDVFGWHDFAAELDSIRGDAPVYCTSYENAAEAAFYMKGRPEVWTMDTGRPTAYDYFPHRPDPMRSAKLVCVVRAIHPGDPLPAPPGLDGFRLSYVAWQTRALGRTVRPRELIVAEK